MHGRIAWELLMGPKRIHTTDRRPAGLPALLLFCLKIGGEADAAAAGAGGCIS